MSLIILVTVFVAFLILTFPYAIFRAHAEKEAKMKVNQWYVPPKVFDPGLVVYKGGKRVKAHKDLNGKISIDE